MHNSTKKALDTLAAAIRDGVYAGNGFLPPERRLCELLVVGRGALQTIFRSLSARGLIRLEPGRGVRVAGQTWQRGLHRILVVEIPGAVLYRSYEHLRILDGIVTMSGKFNTEIILRFAGVNTSAEKLIRDYSAGGYEGIVIAERFRLADIESLIRHGIPVVVANSESSSSIPCTKVDFREVGRIAGREMSGQGHRNIGVLLGGAESFIFREMLSGLKGALAEDDLRIAPENILFCGAEEHAGAPEQIDAALVEMLSAKDRPTAVFVARDWRAGCLYDTCGRLNIRIPDDLSVISYDALSWPSAETAGLTTIGEPATELGGQAVMMLKSWVETGDMPESVMVRGELIRRNSVRRL